MTVLDFNASFSGTVMVSMPFSKTLLVIVSLFPTFLIVFDVLYVIISSLSFIMVLRVTVDFEVEYE